MSRSPFLSLILLVASVAFAQDETNEQVVPPRDSAYELLWADEFDKDGRPDPAIWNFERGFVRNNELQWYREDNATCKDGRLVIEARREQVSNPRYQPDSRNWRREREHAQYTSASLTSSGKKEFTFGRIEVRARFNALSGLWPAIWTTGCGRWPHGGEIDIMEFYQDKVLANFCWAGLRGRPKWDSSEHPVTGFDPETWNEKFHLWVTEWDENEISIYLDGHLLNTLDMSTTRNEDGPMVNPFLAPQYMRLNMAIGSNGGDPSETQFPQTYEVDYVRVWQKKDQS